jgi:GntR family transcriptional regulator
MAHSKYQQIAEQLRDKISAGELKPGERLPSEPDLVRDFQASRNTVRLALAQLTNQGLVVTRQGLGTFVQELPKPFTALLSRQQEPSREDYVDAELPVLGPANDETGRFIVETAPASASVAAALSIPEGDPVVIRRSQRHLEGVPWLLIVSYFPMDLAKGTALELAGPVEQGSIKLLGDLGHPQVGFVDEISARMPDAREFDFFGLTTGTPVIVVDRTAYAADRPIRLSRYIYRGDRVRLVHEVARVPDRFRTS